MNLSNKKILNLTAIAEHYNQIKNGEKKSEFRDYNKHWIQKLSYPCGTFKNFDFISFQKENETDAPLFYVEYKGIKIVKGKNGWFGTKKYFEIELGEIINE